jgi:CubicO group peptidase (beta-lactamase class C family)
MGMRGCPACGQRTRAELPAGVPRRPFGPRFTAGIALLSGRYRLSRREVRQLLQDLWSLRVSLGAVVHQEQAQSAALAPVVEEVHAVVQQAKAVNMDETGWRQELNDYMHGLTRRRGGRMARTATSGQLVSRRQLLQATAGVATAAASVAFTARQGLAAPTTGVSPVGRALSEEQGVSDDPLFRALDEKILDAMSRYQVPGVAVAVLYNGAEYVRGYGLTNVDYPLPVDGDTLFRIGSLTKTFTGTAIMRLVDQGKLDLNAPVRAYLPALELADDSVAATVTVRQLLNHSAGWLGDDYADYGRGDDALARYVAGMQQLPQRTALGQVFTYNNAAVNLAGRVIEIVAGLPYEAAIRQLLLDPLGLTRSGFFTDELVGNNITASHVVENGLPVIDLDEQPAEIQQVAAHAVAGGPAVVDPTSWTFPRSLHPTGGLISSARDQLAYARFHLGDGAANDGAPLLSRQALVAMRSNPGPGGTLVMEIDGVCVSWWQRRTAEGVPVFEHGGAWGGQNCDFFIVPDRGFAMTILTNSTTGPKLLAELSYSGWALSHFVGLNNPPAVPQSRSAAELAPYTGRYTAGTIPTDGTPDHIEELEIELTAENGGLRLSGDLEATLAFYRDDYVVSTSPTDQVSRSDFVRGPHGRVAWFRDRGRIYAHQS